MLLDARRFALMRAVISRDVDAAARYAITPSDIIFFFSLIIR